MKISFIEQKFHGTIWHDFVYRLADEGKFTDYISYVPGESKQDSYIEWLRWMEQTWTIKFKFKDDDIENDVEEVEIEDEYYTLLLLKYKK